MFRPTCRSSSGLSSLVSGECYASGGPVVLYCWTALFGCDLHVLLRWSSLRLAVFGVVGRFSLTHFTDHCF
jgi:hypothetical protein